MESWEKNKMLEMLEAISFEPSELASNPSSVSAIRRIADSL